MESVTSYAETKLSRRVCLGDSQQFNCHHWRYNRKEPYHQEDDPRRRGLPISPGLHGINLPSPIITRTTKSANMHYVDNDIYIYIYHSYINIIPS